MAAPDVCDCGRVIEQPATGRRRTKCLICSPPDKRDRRRSSEVVVALLGGAGDTAEHPIVAATRRELGDLADTADGLVVLQLAAKLTDPRATASGLASLSKRYAEAKADVMRGREQSAGAAVVAHLFSDRASGG